MPDTMTPPTPEDTARIAGAYHAAAKPKPKLVEVALEAVTIGERVRKSAGDLMPLVESMRSLGLLHPIVITRKRELVAGERRLLAAQALGWDTIPARVVDIERIVLGEYAENEVRLNFTASERVAIKKAIQGEVERRQGARTDLGRNIGRSGRPDDIAAERAGFGSADTASQAESVVKRGTDALRNAMDREAVSISAAAQIATLPPEVQDAVVAEPDKAPAVAKAVRSKAPAAVKLAAAPKGKPIPVEIARKAVNDLIAQSKPLPTFIPPEMTSAFNIWTFAVRTLAESDVDPVASLRALPSLNDMHLDHARAALPKLQAWITALEGVV